MDYKYILDNLDTQSIINLIMKLGSDDYVEKEDCVIFKTICHNEDASGASMKLYYYKKNKRFYCYSECGSLNIFQFLEHYYETHNIPYNWFQDIYYIAEQCVNLHNFNDFNYHSEYTKKSDKYKKQRAPQLKTYDNKILEVFIKEYPIEWLNDGISKEAMDKFNIRYSISQNKIIIPHYDINNQLIGIRGRALNEEEAEKYGKYMPVKIENNWYAHKLSLNLYGLNINKNNIRKNGIAILCESEKAVLQADSFKRDNCVVATCGSNLNKYQLKLLLKECRPKEIIIAFDKEELPHEEKYFNKLYSICNKYNNYCNFSFIYDRSNLLKLKDSPTDRGEEIFEQLIKERVRVK